MTKTLFAVLFSLALGGTAWAASNEAEALSVSCAGCHGSEGASKADVPIIGGLSQAYLDQRIRQWETDYARGWYKSIAAEAFG